jgi:ABC-type nitrate/sulfonate/bicarbonate transport system permease component
LNKLLRALPQRAVQLGFLLVAGLAWQWAVSNGHVSPLILPPLSLVWKNFSGIIVSGAFWPDLRVTLTELISAFALASIAGCGVGYLVSRAAFAVRVFDPLLAGMYSIPAILLYPLYVLFFGIGTGSKIAIGTTIAFFPVVLSTIAGLANVNRALIASARSMGASDWQMFAQVMMPAAFPVVLAGLRLGLVIALLSILGTETIASFEGLGHQIVSHAESMETAQMFAWVLLAVLTAFAMNAIASALEARGQRGRE